MSSVNWHFIYPAMESNDNAMEMREIETAPYFVPVKGGKVFRSSTGEEYKDTRRRSVSGRIIEQGGVPFTASMKPAVKLGLGITPYTARHTVSNFLTRERLQDERDAILGHAKSVKTVYVHLPNKDLIKAIESLPSAEKLGCKLAGKVDNTCTKQGKQRKGKVE